MTLQVNPQPPYLRVFLNASGKGGKKVTSFKWEEVKEHTAPSSIVIHGGVAGRVLELIRMYWNKRIDPEWTDPRDPNCHSSAMYAAGLISSSWSLQPEKFPGIYNGLEGLLTYEKPSPPAVVHLLSEKIQPDQLGRINGDNCPHSALYIGELDGKEVCFQKFGFGNVRFGFLRKTGKSYATPHRLWISV